MRDLVAGLIETLIGELIVAALGLLDGEHVDIGPVQPRDHPIYPGPNRIHVPCRQPHCKLASFGSGSGSGMPVQPSLGQRDGKPAEPAEWVSASVGPRTGSGG